MSEKHILVMGGGPAGTATAIGLARIGYRVSLIHAPRTFVACEGISRRTLEGLVAAGCHQAATTVAPPSPKFACWNGERNQFNTEHLIPRPDFDEKLIDDLHASGVTLVSGRVQHIEDSSQQWQVSYQNSQSQSKIITADYLVEARGRSGALPCRNQMRGPETVSLMQRWQIDHPETASMAASYRNGWAWLAKLGSMLYTQVTLSAHDPRIPKKAALQQFIEDELSQLPETTEWLASSHPIGLPTARGSTSILSENPVNDRLIRVGDTALAPDPLSGNGIFASLSLGLAAPAVINTVLNHPERASLAQKFYQDKCIDTFLRFSRTGRDFYALEQRWEEQQFWRDRRQWPDKLALHREFDPEQTQIKESAVLAQNEIISKEVLVTADQPLGIWQVAGIEIAPIVKAMQRHRQNSLDWVKARLLEQPCQQHQRAAVLDWLYTHNFLTRK